MVPFVDALGEALGGKAAFTVWRNRWKRLHFGRSGGEDVSVGGEPIGRLAFVFFPVGFVAKVENLHLDAIGKTAFSGGEFSNGSRAGPSEDAGIASVLFVHPLADEFEVFNRLLHANYTDRFSGAGGVSAVPGPGFGIAIHVHKVGAGKFAPALSGAIDEGLFEGRSGFGFRRFYIREALGGENAEGKEGGSYDGMSAEFFQNHDLAIRHQDRNLVGFLNKNDQLP